MSVIDKTMYETIKNWWDGNGPKNQFVMYVNSHDRALTSATIRKMMYEIFEEDIHGEEYIVFYSAENFYRNMRGYYTEIAELYRHNPGKDDPIIDIIKELPSTCGWLTLIVEDMEALKGQPEKTQEMFETFMKFAAKRASVILIGDGDYKDVFSGCEYVLGEMDAGISFAEEDNKVRIGCYDQENTPDCEVVVYDTSEKQREELTYYWEMMYEQLEKGYFDFESFKPLFKETLEYIVPRVSKQKIYRNDLWLIENIGAMRKNENKDIDGCKPWEFDAAKKLSVGLHKAIVNTYGYNNEMFKGEVALDATIEEPEVDCGAIHISGHLGTTIKVDVDNVCRKLDDFSLVIHKGSYEGDWGEMWKLLQETKLDSDDDTDVSPEAIEKVGNSLSSVMAGIKEAAEKTLNKDPGLKVYRCRDTVENDDIGISDDDAKSSVKILERNYDVTSDKIKGIDKLEDPNVKNCKLSRFIVTIGEDGYIINEDGNPEMTQKGQAEYDDYVSKIRESMVRDEIRILDEGYGEGEDELEWHITACIMREDDDVGGIYEIDTCVRTRDEE